MRKLILIEGPQGTGKTLFAEKLGGSQVHINHSFGYKMPILNELQLRDIPFLKTLLTAGSIAVKSKNVTNKIEIIFVTSHDDNVIKILKESRRLTGVISLTEVLVNV